MARRTTRRSNNVRLDFTGVETRVNAEEGEHLVEVVEVTQEQGDKADYFAWKFKVTEGDSKGALLYLNTSLAPQALWNLRSLLEALGVEIPDEAFDLDLDEMPGLEMMAAVELETWEGKRRPRIVDFWRAEKKASAKAPAKASAKNGKEPELLTQDQINDMSQDELDDVIGEYKLDVDLSEFKTLRRMRAAVIDAAEAEGVLASG